MKWEFVFNTNLCPSGRDNQVRKATEAGYKFMCFNGIVYFLVDGECKDTGLTTKNLI